MRIVVLTFFLIGVACAMGPIINPSSSWNFYTGSDSNFQYKVDTIVLFGGEGERNLKLSFQIKGGLSSSKPMISGIMLGMINPDVVCTNELTENCISPQTDSIKVDAASRKMFMSFLNPDIISSEATICSISVMNEVCSSLESCEYTDSTYNAYISEALYDTNFNKFSSNYVLESMSKERTAVRQQSRITYNIDLVIPDTFFIKSTDVNDKFLLGLNDQMTKYLTWGMWSTGSFTSSCDKLEHASVFAGIPVLKQTVPIIGSFVQVGPSPPTTPTSPTPFPTAPPTLSPTKPSVTISPSSGPPPPPEDLTWGDALISGDGKSVIIFKDMEESEYFGSTTSYSIEESGNLLQKGSSSIQLTNKRTFAHSRKKILSVSYDGGVVNIAQDIDDNNIKLNTYVFKGTLWTELQHTINYEPEYEPHISGDSSVIMVNSFETYNKVHLYQLYDNQYTRVLDFDVSINGTKPYSGDKYINYFGDEYISPIYVNSSGIGRRAIYNIYNNEMRGVLTIPPELVFSNQFTTPTNSFVMSNDGNFSAMALYNATSSSVECTLYEYIYPNWIEKNTISFSSEDQYTLELHFSKTNKYIGFSYISVSNNGDHSVLKVFDIVTKQEVFEYSSSICKHFGGISQDFTTTFWFTESSDDQNENCGVVFTNLVTDAPTPSPTVPPGTPTDAPTIRPTSRPTTTPQPTKSPTMQGMKSNSVDGTLVVAIAAPISVVFIIFILIAKKRMYSKIDTSTYIDINY